MRVGLLLLLALVPAARVQKGVARRRRAARCALSRRLLLRATSAAAAVSARRMARACVLTRLPRQLGAVLHQLRRSRAARSVSAAAAQGAASSVAQCLRRPTVAMHCSLSLHAQPTAEAPWRRARYGCLQSGTSAEAPLARRAEQGLTRLIHHGPFLGVLARDLHHGAGAEVRRSGQGGDSKWRRAQADDHQVVPFRRSRGRAAPQAWRT